VTLIRSFIDTTAQVSLPSGQICRLHARGCQANGSRLNALVVVIYLQTLFGRSHERGLIHHNRSDSAADGSRRQRCNFDGWGPREDKNIDARSGISDTRAASLRVISMISVLTVCLINRKRELIKLYIQRSAHLFDRLKDHASSDVTSKLITLGGRCCGLCIVT